MGPRNRAGSKKGGLQVRRTAEEEDCDAEGLPIGRTQTEAASTIEINGRNYLQTAMQRLLQASMGFVFYKD